jgi:hypothetical protein
MYHHHRAAFAVDARRSITPLQEKGFVPMSLLFLLKINQSH